MPRLIFSCLNQEKSLEKTKIFRPIGVQIIRVWFTIVFVGGQRSSSRIPCGR